MVESSKSRISSAIQSSSRLKYQANNQPKPVDEAVKIKQQLVQGLGYVDPMIQKGVEELLTNTAFKRRSKDEVYSSFVQGLHKKVQELNESQV